MLAVVAAGLVRGRYSPEIVSPEMRIMARSVWNLLVFMLNSLIFMLIGVQLSDAGEKLVGHSLGQLLLWGLFVSVAAVLVRFVWVFPVAYLPRWLSGSLHEHEPKHANNELAIISWCGMRGIVSLAAALALPMTLPNGAPFPYRDLIIFLTFCVIVITLVGKGLTLPALIRGLNVGTDWSMHDEQQHVRAAVGAAAQAAIDDIVAAESVPYDLAERLRAEMAGRFAQAASEGADPLPGAELEVRLRRAAILAERKELIRLWRENKISDEVMHHIEELLDYQQAELD